jgi:hypothetical protein
VHLVGIEPFVEPGGAGEIPRVHEHIAGEEPVDARFERGATGEAFVLGRGDRRVVEGGLHGVARVAPRRGGVVVD